MHVSVLTPTHPPLIHCHATLYQVLTQLFGHIAKSIEVAVDVSTQQFKVGEEARVFVPSGVLKSCRILLCHQMKSFHQDPADSPLSARYFRG